MPGRVLIVDDSATNRLLIRARLTAAYYDVIEAETGEEALERGAADRPDLVLLDIMLPGIDGFEVCRRFKADPATGHVPVVMLTALEGRADRLRGLETGADDFLSKPVDEVALLSRVASLTRMKMMVDELVLRSETASGIGGDRASEVAHATRFPDSRLLIVGARGPDARRMGDALQAATGCEVAVAGSESAAEALIDDTAFDAVLIDGARAGAHCAAHGGDPLRLGSLVRSRPETRRAAVLLVVGAGETALAAKALELGFSDYVASPVDLAELIARVRLHLRRKHYADQLRRDARDSVREALTDPLTGAYNRRYASAHLDALIARSRRNPADLTVMMIDLDRFKQVNDRHGHAAGDAVLREFTRRLQASVRSVDLVARLGGEEFMVVMPDADPRAAAEIAERVRTATADPPFRISGDGGTEQVTVSIGYAVLAAGESVTGLVARADRALYASKNAGRNRATLDAA